MKSSHVFIGRAAVGALLSMPGAVLGQVESSSVSRDRILERIRAVRERSPVSRDARASAGVPVCGDGLLDVDEECEPTSDANCPGQCIAPGEVNECTCDRICSLEACEFCEASYGENGPFLTHGGLFFIMPQTPYTLIEVCDCDYDTELIAGVSAECNALLFYNTVCADTTCGTFQNQGSPFSACFDADCTCNSEISIINCDGTSCGCVPTPVGVPYRFMVGETNLGLVPPVGSNTRFRLTPMIDCEAGPMPSGACCDLTTGTCTDDVLEMNCQGNVAFTADTLCAKVSCVSNGIPAANAWGMVGLAIATLICATVWIGRRGGTAA